MSSKALIFCNQLGFCQAGAIFLQVKVEVSCVADKGSSSRAVHRILLLIRARRRTMSIQVYQDPANKAETSGQDAGALVVLPNGLEITAEEHQKRIKDVSFHTYSDSQRAGLQCYMRKCCSQAQSLQLEFSHKEYTVETSCVCAKTVPHGDCSHCRPRSWSKN